MRTHLVPMPDSEATAGLSDDRAGLGALVTEKGNLPLRTVEAAVSIAALVARTRLTQGFANPHDVPLEATYVFPLPDRAAVTALRMTAAGHTVAAELKERGQARDEYDRAIAEGRRAAIAEEERPDVFTMRVGNILPGERVTVELTLVGPLSYDDGEATYRLPLVVAPRYIPGRPAAGEQVGDGYAWDTNAVPDASRITPPVLLPGFPNPVRLSIDVDIDDAGLRLSEVRSSLHAVVREGNHVRIEPGERVNRDFILRLAYGEPDAVAHSLALAPDGETGEGTFRLTVLPPRSAAPPRPRDVVLLLDRSGSMGGWKMVAARRAAARMVDTLTAADRFAVLAFDNVVETPPALPDGLVVATDRNRYRAVEHLARVDARGGTELLTPLTTGLALLGDSARERVLVLVTDGQVGNEDQILARTATLLAGVRVHTVGIDEAVNAGFLGRLAAAGGGRCELVESENRLDEAMDHIHRRVGAPLVTALSLAPEALEIIDDTASPARLPDLFPGAPLVVTGRYREGGPDAAVTVHGRTRDGAPWSVRPPAAIVADTALTTVWARAHLRDLEDAYVGLDRFASDGPQGLERRIVETSLRFGVLCRFTAWLAVDTRVVTGTGEVHRVIQPVEPAAGWDMLEQAAPMVLMAGAAAAPMRVSPAMMAPPPTAARRRGFRRSAPTGTPPPSMPAARPDELAAARSQAADEARRLREIEQGHLPERREALADLATRLAALLGHLAGAGVDEAVLAPVRDLLGELAADRPLGIPADVFEELWSRTVRVLDDLASSPDGGTGAGAAMGKRRRGAGGTRSTSKEFWKRGR